MTILKYGNTDAFFDEVNNVGLLVDADYVETLPASYKTLKQNGIKIKDIKCDLSTHCPPDHMGLSAN